jgi:hypothetical protein
MLCRYAEARFLYRSPGDRYEKKQDGEKAPLDKGRAQRPGRRWVSGGQKLAATRGSAVEHARIGAVIVREAPVPDGRLERILQPARGCQRHHCATTAERGLGIEPEWGRASP